MNPIENTAEQGTSFGFSTVLFHAMQGLDLVEQYLEEAEHNKDADMANWLRETRTLYGQILASAEKYY
ncbi:MAG: hypothetical protein K9L59_12565 [Desulfobacterales bacterium]|nr:hypothetical protein [Desulfobacterales bacterium]MCF8080009.1 hypothetical protein [Desulfobacterales bacterium]